MFGEVPAPEQDWNDLRALAEQVEDHAMVVLDLQGRVMSWNRGAERLTGHAAERIRGQSYAALYRPEDRQAGVFESDLQRARETGQARAEGWRVRADGSAFWASASVTLLRGPAGEPRALGVVTADLTRVQGSLDELRRSEERFRLLIEGVADYAIFMLDPTGHVRTWNAGAQKLKGYRAEQIIGQDFSVFFTPEDRERGLPAEELLVAREQGRFAEEGLRVRADGSRFWASAVVTALKDASGQLVGFSKITRDLSERKLAEDTAAALREQQLARAVAEASEARAKQERERYRLLSRQLEVILEGVVDGITVQDRSGAVIFANSAAARLCGLASKEELLRSSRGDLLSRFEVLDPHGFRIPPDQLPGRRVLAGEAQASALLLIRDKGRGSHWWCQLRANAVLDEHGAPELAINIWHDVSQQRRQDENDRVLSEASATLGRSLDYRVTLEALARLLVPGLCDWCSIHLLEGSQLRHVAVAHADPRKRKQAVDLQEQYPPSPDDTTGIWQMIRTGQPILHAQLPGAAKDGAAQGPEHSSRLRDMGIGSVIFAPIKVREEVAGALSLFAADSGRRYDARDAALAMELGRRVGAFIENAMLFERSRAAARRAEEAAREAEAAGRLKDEFLATVSHELRTPLNAIMGWSSLLRSRSDAASVAKGIEVIHRNAQSQSKIIEDILDVSRIITGKLRLELKSVDLGAIASESLEAVRTSATARDVRLELDKPAAPVLLVGDAERLQQVMWNLLSNAVKFTERGGHVWVSVRQERSQLIVRVQDDGKGIEPEFLPYVFDRFKQADSSTTRRYGGLGLGLAIVRHIVELHGGRAAVTSAGSGRGTTFEIVLPIRATVPAALPSERPENPGTAPDRERPRAQLAGVRVLVVDDEVDARDLLHLVLKEAGASVQTAGTALAAMARLAAEPPHVIVSDIGMPDEDGYALVQRIRGAGSPVSGIPAIALTAYTRMEDREKALAMGFTAHLGKPVNSAELLDLVATLAKTASE